jgi:type IV pilus assembly protein PilM
VDFPPPDPAARAGGQPAAGTPSAPTVTVHPPVPAAELPPLPGEERKPFWKRELGRKRDGSGAASARPEGGLRAKAAARAAAKERAIPKKIVGLKVGASQIAAATVANNGAAELQQVAREPLADGVVVAGELRDPERLAESLKEFFTKHKLPTKGVRLGIATNRIGVRTFDIAGIDDPKQLANAIRYRAQEALPIPIEEAVLDFHVLAEHTDGEGATTRRILLVVAYRELIDRYVDACRKAGIVLVGIDLEAFALLRALAPPQEGWGGDTGAALVVVSIGHERSTFAVSDGRVCEFTRVLEWGGAALNVALARTLDIAPSEAESVKRQVALHANAAVPGLTAEQGAQALDAVRRQIQTFARELVSSLQFYQSQPGSLGIGEIILTGGSAHLQGFAAQLQRLIGVKVRIGDPLVRVKVPKRFQEPEQIGSLAVAIGLGIED